jgi:hypothetical protein
MLHLLSVIYTLYFRTHQGQHKWHAALLMPVVNVVHICRQIGDTFYVRFVQEVLLSVPHLIMQLQHAGRFLAKPTGTMQGKHFAAHCVCLQVQCPHVIVCLAMLKVLVLIILVLR